ncbi:MAG: hypothetical protein MUE97_02940 [Phycisphaerales bacterium]|jgi:hypothetical protein|nr:hypothetical protein [Phycisphaerales bacterium]
MRALLITDPGFARREAELLNHLATGLADEGVRVFNAVDQDEPEATPTTSPLPRASMPFGRASVPGAGFGPASGPGRIGSRLGLFATDVPYAARGLPFTATARARQLAQRASSLPVGRGLDIVHAMGTSTWDTARLVAIETGASLVLEVWSGAMIQRAATWLSPLDSRWQANVWLSVADDALALAASVRVPGVSKQRVVACPWGAHVSPDPHRPMDLQAEATILLWAGEAWSGSVEQALRGITRWAQQSGRTPLILTDGPTARRLNLWAEAGRLGLREALSLVPGELADWHPALDADVLLIPGAIGEQSGLVLAAQGAGVPIIARADELAGNLIDNVSARLVMTDSPQGWGDALALLGDPAGATGLGHATRKFITEHRLAFQHVSRAVAMYDRCRATT